MDLKPQFIGELSTKCAVCGQPVEGTTVSLEEFLSSSNLKIGDRLGHRCAACGLVSCAACKAKGIGFNWWSGYDRASCSSCGIPFGRQHSTSLVIVPVKSRTSSSTSPVLDSTREFVVRDVLLDSGELGDLFIQASGLSFVNYGIGLAGVAVQDLLYTAGFGFFGKALGAGTVAKQQALADRMHEQVLARRADFGLSVSDRVKKRNGSFEIPRDAIAGITAQIERLDLVGDLVGQDCLAILLKTASSERRIVQIQSSTVVNDVIAPLRRLLENLTDGSLMPGLEHDDEWGFSLGRTTGAQFVNHIVTGDLIPPSAAAVALEGNTKRHAFMAELREAIDGLGADQMNTLISNLANAPPAVRSLVRGQLAGAAHQHVAPWITAVMVLGGGAGIVASLLFKDSLGGWFWVVLIASIFVVFCTRETLPSSARRIRLGRCLACLDAAAGQ